VKILITGGAGFIGSHLADRLLARGDQVFVIDNYATGTRDNLTEHPNFTLLEGTIADLHLVNRSLDEFRPDVVVHAAASYKNPDDWQEDILTNVLGTSYITHASLRLGVRRLIYFQTSLCYGLHPLEQPITLEHPIRPAHNSYAISKTAGEQYIAMSGADYISFRLANAYGPRNVSGPLPTFYRRLSTNQPCFVTDTRRDFIYITDVIDLVELAVDGKGHTGPYHVSSGSDYSIKEIFDAAVDALGPKHEQEVEVRPRTPDDTYTILIDPSKTNHDFGWKTTTTLEVGVRAAIDWYQKHQVTQTFTHLKLPDSTNRG
jgi:UDP-glucose 4-epimerase